MNRCGYKKIAHGNETLAIGNLNSHNSKAKTLNKNLKIVSSPKYFQVTFCHFLKYPRTGGDQKLNKMIVVPLLAAISDV